MKKLLSGKREEIFQKYSLYMGIALLVMQVIDLFLALLAFLGVEAFQMWKSPALLLCKCAVSVAAGIVSLYQSNKSRLRVENISAIGLCGVGVAFLLLYGKKGNIDSLIDLSLFLILMIFSIMVITYVEVKKWDVIVRKNQESLDLRITKRGDLFDSMVLFPHLEINNGIVGAVDHFLETAEQAAPLYLCIHSAETISVPLQETMIESFRDHYLDEERRVNSFLEGRFNRVLCLFGVSIAALRLLSLSSGGDISGTVWTIVSNFAAFSLWQIGGTYFECSEALKNKMRYRIAKNTSIHFI